MLGVIKRAKLLYSIYNFFHRQQLVQNEKKLAALGLNKKYYSPLSSKDFVGLPGSVPGVVQTDRQKLQATQLFTGLDAPSKESLSSFAENGFAVIYNYLSASQVDEVNNEIANLLAAKKVKFTYGRKIMFAIHQSKLLWNLGDDPQLKELLAVLLNGQPTLFQSINFLMGSEQETHSDSIHMTTYPVGGLLGVWIALEDVTQENGPLHYYPGSHKLPYYFNADYDNEGSQFFLGSKSYTDYEEMIKVKIKEQQIAKTTFFAKKGDLLIWHANLFHGGEPHLNKQKTRKSMVLHYFKEGSICYHEITQRPALIKKFG